MAKNQNLLILITDEKVSELNRIIIEEKEKLNCQEKKPDSMYFGRQGYTHTLDYKGIKIIRLGNNKKDYYYELNIKSQIVDLLLKKYSSKEGWSLKIEIMLKIISFSNSNQTKKHKELNIFRGTPINLKDHLQSLKEGFYLYKINLPYFEKIKGKTPKIKSYVKLNSILIIAEKDNKRTIKGLGHLLFRHYCHQKEQSFIKVDTNDFGESLDFYQIDKEVEVPLDNLNIAKIYQLKNTSRKRKRDEDQTFKNFTINENENIENLSYDDESEYLNPNI